jgi:hypothetical protein
MVRSFDGNNSLVIAIAFAPLTLITPIAPMPGGVANATIVSSQPESLLIIQQRYPYQNKGIKRQA